MRVSDARTHDSVMRTLVIEMGTTNSSAAAQLPAGDDEELAAVGIAEFAMANEPILYRPAFGRSSSNL